MGTISLAAPGSAGLGGRKNSCVAGLRGSKKQAWRRAGTRGRGLGWTERRMSYGEEVALGGSGEEFFSLCSASGHFYLIHGRVVNFFR